MAMFAVKFSHNIAPLWIVRGLILAANVGVLAYEIYKIAKITRNPVKEVNYVDLLSYKQVIDNNKR